MLWVERKMKYEKKRCFGSVRYANGEYAAEQPQGLPAVRDELTRWAAQNIELTFKSIGNQRRIPAIRKTQTEAEDHKKKQQRLKSRCALACNLGGRGAPF